MFSNQGFKLLLAVDGSEHAMAAIELVSGLPITRGYSPENLVMAVAVNDQRHHSHRDILLSILEKTKQILEEKDIPCSTALLDGDPAAEITRYASEATPDLIVMGAKGLRATLGILLGGVAQQVVEYASSPALVVRAPYQGLRRVLVATDGSKCSEGVVQYLCRFPWPEGVSFRVVHVMQPLPQAARYWPLLGETMPMMTIDDELFMQSWQDDLQSSGKELIDRTQAQIAEAGLQATSELLQGDTATTLIDYILKNQIDLFIAGSRGLSEVQAWLLGSVSRKLLHYASCSGLIVKGTFCVQEDTQGGQDVST